MKVKNLIAMINELRKDFEDIDEYELMTTAGSIFYVPKQLEVTTTLSMGGTTTMEVIIR